MYEVEWWHFDYRDWRAYPILNIAFEDLSVRKLVKADSETGLKTGHSIGLAVGHGL